MMPVKSDGTPLCTLPELRHNPHAWIKLWKHHAAQPEANKLNEIARENGYGFLKRYGNKISSEWFFPKVWQILDEDPEIYAAADRIIEAGVSMAATQEFENVLAQRVTGHLYPY